MSAVLVTGAGTGIGNLIARALARAGHRVYASTRAPAPATPPAPRNCTAWPRPNGSTCTWSNSTSPPRSPPTTRWRPCSTTRARPTSSSTTPVTWSYVEAFTAEEIAHLIDVHALGVQRPNRAALPHLRAQGHGTLLYVGSTIPVTTPPFLGPYVVSKAAMDALALPFGGRPLRSVVDLTDSMVEQANSAVLTARTDFVRRTGFEEILHAARA